MIGSVALCRHNIVGVINKIVTDSNGNVTLYKGKSLEGRPWQSKSPKILANSLEEYNKINEGIKTNA
jgi:hypothetical protein